jgi:hypothetical protein
MCLVRIVIISLFEWLPFPLDYDYEVSAEGKVRNSNTKKVLKELPGTNGYYKYCLNNSWYSAHRVVALTWVDNQNETINTQVNHKDGNKTNNRADNLEWVSPSNNIKHAIDTGLIKFERPKRTSKRRNDGVVMRDASGNVRYFNSSKECAEDLGISYDYLVKGLRKKPEMTYRKLEVKFTLARNWEVV